MMVVKQAFVSRSHYALAALAVFALEVVIALFVNDAFVRPFVGDALAVILVYLGLRAATPLRPRVALGAALGVALGAEALALGAGFFTVFFTGCLPGCAGEVRGLVWARAVATEPSSTMASSKLQKARRGNMSSRSK